MPLSQNTATAEAFQGYIRDFHDQLLNIGVFGFDSLPFISLLEGIKGQHVLTEVLISDLAYKWNKDFEPIIDAVDFKPRVLQVECAKVDLSFVPQDFEKSYLGAARQRGQHPGTDLPYEGFILQKIMQKLKNEIEIAIWQANIPGVAPASPKLNQIFKGFLKLVTDELVAVGTRLTPYAVPGGAITPANVISVFEGLWKKLDPAYKNRDVNMYCSFAVKQMLQEAYRDAKFTMYTDKDLKNTLRLDFGPATVVALPGIPDSSQRIICTEASNVFVGFDALSDTDMMYVETRKRCLDFWADFKMGVQFGIMADELMSVTDTI